MLGAVRKILYMKLVQMHSWKWSAVVAHSSLVISSRAYCGRGLRRRWWSRCQWKRHVHVLDARAARSRSASRRSSRSTGSTCSPRTRARPAWSTWTRTRTRGTASSSATSCRGTTHYVTRYSLLTCACWGQRCVASNAAPLQSPIHAHLPCTLLLYSTAYSLLYTHVHVSRASPRPCAYSSCQVLWYAHMIREEEEEKRWSTPTLPLQRVLLEEGGRGAHDRRRVALVRHARGAARRAHVGQLAAARGTLRLQALPARRLQERRWEPHPQALPARWNEGTSLFLISYKIPLPLAHSPK